MTLFAAIYSKKYSQFLAVYYYKKQFTWFFLTSSAARSISTHNDQITHNAAAKWNKTAQNKRRRSTPDISKLRHWTFKIENQEISYYETQKHIIQIW